MSTVTEIIEAVKRLDGQEKEEFLDCLVDLEFEDTWDRQIEADAAAGKLDNLWQKSLADIEAGNTRSLDEVLGESK